jgi:hypothetical protein
MSYKISQHGSHISKAEVLTAIDMKITVFKDPSTPQPCSTVNTSRYHRLGHTCFFLLHGTTKPLALSDLNLLCTDFYARLTSNPEDVGISYDQTVATHVPHYTASCRRKLKDYSKYY